MKKGLKILAFTLSLMFLTSEAKALTADELATCLNGTDTTCQLTESVTLTSDVEITSDKVLDLNSYTLTTEKSIVVSANLKIKGGRIESSTVDPLIKVTAGNELEVSNATLKNTANYSDVIKLMGSTTDTTDLTKVTINSDATLEGNYGISISNGGNNYGAVVDFYGKFQGITGNNGYDRGTIGINLNGNNKAKTGNVPVINIYEDAVITSVVGTNSDANRAAGPAIYAAGYGIWNIYGGTITGTEALSIKSGVFNISGGLFTANGAFVSPETVQAYNNGSETTGAAISITGNDGYASGVELNISYADVVSQNGYAVFEGITKGTTPAVKGMNITNGDFNGAVGAVYAENATAFIEGGAYNGNIEAYLADTSNYVEVDGVYFVGTEHNIIIEKMENGTLTASAEKSLPGQTVKLTTKANEGYKLSKIKVLAAYGEEIVVTDGSFIMPNDDVTITAEFVKIVENPNTIDNIVVYVLIGLISLIGFGIASRKFKKQMN